MFVNSLKFLVRFGSEAMFDEISQTNLIPFGENLTPSISTNGYVMQDNQYLFGDGISSNGFNLDITEEYTIGFWLYPVGAGLAFDESSGVLASIEMPILSFVDNSSSEQTVIEITEHTQTSGNSSIRVLERGDYYAFSEEYTINKWHYFWITRSSSGLRIFVDGIENTLQNESGSLQPDIISGLNPLLNLYINHSLDGYSASVAKNIGILDDVFFLNVINTSQVDIQRAINSGILYVVDDIYTEINIVESDIYMNDPGTITINSMIDDLSYIFIGRNDGKIMRGSALLWETRRSFSDPNEYANFDISSPVDGFLELNNNTIRL